MVETLKSEEYSEEYYDKFCRTHEELVIGNVPSGYPTALKFINPLKGDRFLDVGCGRGEIVMECTKNGAYSVGIDYSNVAAELARKNGNKNIIRASATHLPFRDNSFNKLAFLGVMEHMDDKDANLGCHELYRVLKKGGYAVCAAPSSWDWVFNSGVRFCNALGIKKTTMSRDDPYHINVKSPIQIRNIFKKQGFNIKFRTDIVYPKEYPLSKRVLRKALFYILKLYWVAYKK